MSTVAYPHVAIRSDGHPITADSHYKVRILVEEYLNGATPAEMQEAHPRLTMSEIHASLSYYYDHKREMDREIAELNKMAEQMMAEAGESIVVKRLREMDNDQLQQLVDATGGPGANQSLAAILKDLGRNVP